MDQTQLYQLTQSMSPGQATTVYDEDMRECARRCQSSLMFASITDKDVEEFVALISKNWGLRIQRNFLHYHWTIRKV